MASPYPRQGRGQNELPEDRDLDRVVVDHDLGDLDPRPTLLLRAGARQRSQFPHRRGQRCPDPYRDRALLELLLIISNVGTAVVPYSIHKRVHEAGAVACVTARNVHAPLDQG